MTYIQTQLHSFIIVPLTSILWDLVHEYLINVHISRRAFPLISTYTHTHTHVSLFHSPWYYPRSCLWIFDKFVYIWASIPVISTYTHTHTHIYHCFTYLDNVCEYSLITFCLFFFYFVCVSRRVFPRSTTRNWDLYMAWSQTISRQWFMWNNDSCA